MKRSLSSVNKPDIAVDDAVDALDGLVLVSDVADEEDASEDDVDACVFGVVLTCCC